ncbi:fibronectin type III domain-containing protein, partial [Pyxidicoccus sp. 3LFB2]
MTSAKLPFPVLLLGALLVTACAKPQAPSAPRELTATGEPGALVLTWLAPEKDGGAAVSSYRVECEPVEAGSAVQVEGLTARVTGLKAGASYRCIVGARNEAGLGPVAEVGPVRVPEVPA